MSRIEKAAKEVVATAPMNTFNNGNPVVEAAMLHTDAKEHLTKVLCNDLSGDEMIALLDSLLDIFTDELDDEMKEARPSRSGVRGHSLLVRTVAPTRTWPLLVASVLGASGSRRRRSTLVSSVAPAAVQQV